MSRYASVAFELVSMNMTFVSNIPLKLIRSSILFFKWTNSIICTRVNWLVRKLLNKRILKILSFTHCTPQINFQDVQFTKPTRCSSYGTSICRNWEGPSHLEIHLTNLYYNRSYKSAPLRYLFTTSAPTPNKIPSYSGN